MNPIDPATLTKLPAILGTDRFQPYVVACKGDHAGGIRLYTWNVEVSAAYLGAFAALEVGLRNAMHSQLSQISGSPSWWSKIKFSAADDARIDEVIEDLNRKKANNWTPGHVVAEMRFGFWVGLLANRYHTKLWEAGLERAFPHLNHERPAVTCTIRSIGSACCETALRTMNPSMRATF